MRKNLFLTLALVLASFASAVAQNWSVTLGSSEGLPGSTVSKDGVSIKYFKSGIISADKAIKTLRFTCAGNSTNHKPNGNNFRMMLSELNVYSADNLATELNYTVTTNADHNSLAKSFDGQGLRALYDGKYNNYFSSMSAGNESQQEYGIFPVTEYHYLELTFEKEISRFVIEWGGKAGSGEAPSVVVLTEGGVAAEPYSDRATSFSEDKITSLNDLLAPAYFTICGNAPTSYHTYDNATGDQTSKEPVEGSGPMYVTLGDVYAEAPTIDYIAQLQPAASNGKYYVYFPMQKKYLSADAKQNALNEALNGWQYATSDVNKAAEITLTPVANGDFEMSYTTISKEGGDITVYIGADPRTGKMKIFSTDRKKALEANGWCQGFGLTCSFNWSFYAAEYSAPTWAKEYELGIVYIAAEEMKAVVEDDGTLAEVISTLKALMSDNNADEEEIQEAIATAKESIGEFMCAVAENEQEVMEGLWDDWKSNSSSSYVAGNWSLEAYETYIQPGITVLEELIDADVYYDYLDAFMDYFTKKEANIAAFEASKYEMQSLPLQYTTDGTALGKDNGSAYVWEQSIGLNKAVSGIRITFIETNVGNAAGGGKWNGYPMVALGELVILDKSGEELTLNSAQIVTNSQELSEGPMTNLVDGDNDSFWHSIWGNGTMNPVGEVYLDVPFGAELDQFTIKIVGRNNKSLSPKTVAISEIGTSYEEGIEVANPYNVKIGAQVTDVANLKDGGLYVLQGNLNVKQAENAANPRFYAGTTPYNTEKNIAEDTPTVYMFKKAADGTWNILSLNKGMFWVEEPEYGASNLILYQSEAGNVQFTKSNNIENAFVMYSVIPDTALTASFTNEDKGINIPETQVTVNRVVYMDWDSGLASRPCYSELPGAIDPQFAEVFAGNEDLLVTGAAGDYLHFNKTNGEGEWNIYEATMDAKYYVYLQALVNEVDNLNLITGNNPGCIVADEATAKAFDNAKAAAKVVVNGNNTDKAEAAATALINAVEAMKDSERVGFNANSIYQIKSGLDTYEENTWATRSVYADATTGTLKWTVSPESFKDGINYEFLFNVITVDEEINTTHRLNVSEELLGKVYIIKLYEQDIYAGAHDDESNNFLTGTQPAAYKINDLGSCDYEIITVDANRYWHTEGHSEGNGYQGRLVNWNCGNNLNTASAWTFIDMGDLEETGIKDTVIDGDEVVSVNYFTPTGMAIAEPVKGINIVVTVYANGVVEAKKVLVK